MRKERPRYENNDTLGVNGQGPKPGPMNKKGRVPASGEQSSGSAKTSGESQSVYSDQFKTVKDWNSNGNVGDGTVGPNLPPRELGGRHKNGKHGKSVENSFALKKEPQ